VQSKSPLAASPLAQYVVQKSTSSSTVGIPQPSSAPRSEEQLPEDTGSAHQMEEGPSSTRQTEEDASGAQQTEEGTSSAEQTEEGSAEQTKKESSSARQTEEALRSEQLQAEWEAEAAEQAYDEAKRLLASPNAETSTSEEGGSGDDEVFHDAQTELDPEAEQAAKKMNHALRKRRKADEAPDEAKARAARWVEADMGRATTASDMWPTDAPSQESLDANANIAAEEDSAGNVLVDYIS